MKRTLISALLLCGVLIGSQNLSNWDVDRFEVPEGFVVEEVLSPEEAGSVVAITFDSHGNLVLAREDSSIITLLDPDEDGTFEQRVFTEEVFNSQGIFFDGPDLIASAEGLQQGDSLVALYRVVDEDGDHRGDRVELMEHVIGRISDHGPHAPYFGPDGYLYWTLGNMAQPWSAHAPLSPFSNYSEGVLALTRTDPRGHADEYRVPGGTFVRKPVETSIDRARAAQGGAGGRGRFGGAASADAGWELVVGGFRNQYDGAFNLMGELFTYDSDMEWDRDLPWFRETRTVHAVPGGDYGWRTGSRKLLDYNFDTLPPAKDQGRGSPTGVTFYQAYNYPSEYWDMFIQADWSRGRIIMNKLSKDGATYSASETENFVYGEPLNVTDVEVGPDGNVYFSLGGRDTEGGIYRVVYTGPDAMAKPQANTPIERVLTMIQPRSAWSRAGALRIKDEIGEAAWQQGLTAVVRDAQAQPERRVRAMELLEVFGPGLDMNTLVPLADDASWEVRAAAAYYLGLESGRGADDAQKELVELLHDADPFVQRRAAEALIRLGIHPAVEVSFSAVDDVMPLLSSEDRYVRYAGRELLRRINRNRWQEAALEASEYPLVTEVLLAYVQTINAPSVKDVRLLIERELELLKANPSDEQLLDLVRLMQLTMLEDQGVTFAGGGWRDPGPGEYPQIADLLVERFPTDDWHLNREIARTLVYLQPEAAVAELAAELDNPQNDREQQIFYAYALSHLPEGWDDASRERMLSWFEKVHNEGWRGGRSFSGYISGFQEDFLANLPDAERVIAEERLNALEQLVATIPGAPPPQTDISNEELFEELVYNPRNFEGDPSEGAVAYQKALCINCHTFGPIGTEVGPDLTTINARFSRADLVRAVMYPHETISDQWQMETITRTNGEVVSGTIYNETAQDVIVQIPAGPQVTIPKSEIQSRERSEVSPMPEGLLNYLDRDEQRDLFLFLEAGPEAIPDSLIQTSSR